LIFQISIPLYHILSLNHDSKTLSQIPFGPSLARDNTHIVVRGLNAHFVKDHTNSKTKYTEDDIVNMINFLNDNIFIEFGGRIFQQTVGIPMGTNCATLLADLFLYSYDAEFVQDLLRKGAKEISTVL